MSLQVVTGFVLAVLYFYTPLALAAMGGILSERSGVVNIALEGFMLFGAFFAVCAADLLHHEPVWLADGAGLLAAVLAGAVFGLLHAMFTQKYGMDHVVSGLGINLLASGVTRYFYLHLYPNGLSVAGMPRVFFVVPALLLPFLVYLFVKRTRTGLRIRSAGENPEGAMMAGVNVKSVRYFAVACSGVFAALGGAYLTLADAHNFSTDISAGKGYIALAAVIFGKWNPLGAAGGALFFGLFFALQTQLEIHNYKLVLLGIHLTNPMCLDTLPYLMTILALAGLVGKSRPPAALGRQEKGTL